MILVIGGLASGKRAYARSLGFAEDDIVSEAQERVREAADKTAAELADELSHEAVVTISEVGAGIVPLDADQRAFRERAGRLGIALAERADAVVHMTCGIPTTLKGDPDNRT